MRPVKKYIILKENSAGGRRHGAPGPALAGRVHISIRRRAVPPLHGHVPAGGLPPAAAGHDRVRAGGRNGASEPAAAGPGAGADGHRGGASAAGLRPVPADGGGKRPSGPAAVPGGGPAGPGAAAAGTVPAGGVQPTVFPAGGRSRGTGRTGWRTCWRSCGGCGWSPSACALCTTRRRPGRRCFCWRPGWVDGRG